MDNPTTRDSLLQATAFILKAEGARHLTLEKVAAQAGVSKGGLLYHFPSKRSLLAALVQFGIDEFEAAIATRLDSGMSYLAAYADASMAEGANDTWASALIGPLFEDATLLEPLRQAMAGWYRRAKDDAGDNGHLLLLVIDGLYLHQLTGIDAGIDPVALHSLFQHLAGIIQKGEER